jgi:hypothetical protein
MGLILLQEVLEAIVISPQEMLVDITTLINPLLVRLEKSNFVDDKVGAWPRDFLNREKPDIDNELRFSVAADLFRKALEQPAASLRWWYKSDCDSKPSEDKLRIGQLLEDAKKMSYNYVKDRSRHIKYCKEDGMNPAEEIFEPNFRVEWPRSGDVYTIVFERGELIEFLNKNGIEHTLDMLVAPEMPVHQKDQQQTIEKLKDVAKKLKAVERDDDVIVARLRDEHKAKYWQFVKIFDIKLPATSKAKDPQKGKEKIIERSINKGRTILKKRLEVK